MIAIAASVSICASILMALVGLLVWYIRKKRKQKQPEGASTNIEVAEAPGSGVAGNSGVQTGVVDEKKVKVVVPEDRPVEAPAHGVDPVELG